MKVALLILSVLMILQAGGCASVVNGPTQVVPVTSNPQGATVILDAAPAGVTPCNVALARTCDHLLTLRMDGYEEKELELHRTASPWVYGNIFLGGLVGIFADTNNGAQFQFLDTKVHVELKCKAASQPSSQQANGSEP